MAAHDDDSFVFTDEFLNALGAWQRGWWEVKDLKKPVEAKLVAETATLPARFKEAPGTCYRKRFLYKADMEPLTVSGGLDDGVASWTTDRTFAKDFKGIVRPDAVTASFFEHKPRPEEVIVNIPALWADEGFRRAAEDYRTREGREARALFNFADRQGEIVLHAKLHADEIRGMVGVGLDFDSACDQAGVPQDIRDALFKTMTDQGVHFGEPTWTSETGAPGIVESTRRKFIERNEWRIAHAVAVKKLWPIWMSTVSRRAMMQAQLSGRQRTSS